VDFFAGIAVGLESDFGFEQFDLRGIFFGWRGLGVLGGCWLLLSAGQGREEGEQKNDCERGKELREASAGFAQGVLKKILGFKPTAVKNCFSRGFLKSVSQKIPR